MLCVVTGVVTDAILITIIINPAPKQTWSQMARAQLLAWPIPAMWCWVVTECLCAVISSRVKWSCLMGLLWRSPGYLIFGARPAAGELRRPGWGQGVEGGGLQWFLLDICWRSWSCMGLVHGLITMLTVDINTVNVRKISLSLFKNPLQ